MTQGVLFYQDMANAWDHGISPAQFRKSRKSDMQAIKMIKSAMSAKNEMNQKARDVMMEMKKW